GEPSALREVNPTVAAAILTARGWSKNQKATVVDLSIAACGSLLDRMEDLTAELNRLDDDERVPTPVQRQIEHLCRKREELASIAVLVREFDDDGWHRLSRALDMLDCEGEVVSRRFPRVDIVDVTGFGRMAVSLLPDEWWTRHVSAE
ncbi:MAG: hypothetical protein EB084_25750, partial [Proteobacteria bacterium]|nr:hypothetical protein [Pseudomonadota bacterium]